VTGPTTAGRRAVSRPLAIAVATASLAALAVSAVLFATGGLVMAELLIFTPALVAFVLVGGFVLERQPMNRIGLLMLAFGAGGCLIYPFAAVAAAPVGTPGAALAGVIVQALDPITYLLVTLLLVAFPDGRLPSPRWRPVVLLAVAGFVLSVLANLFTPGPQFVFPQHDNPLGVDSAALKALGGIGYLFAGVTMLAAAASLVVRWRGSGPVVRAQLKWIAFAGAVLGTTTALYVLSFAAWGVTLLPMVASAVAFSLLPVTVAIAVLRFQLFEIDRLVSRTIGWAIVTATLVGLFAALVVGLQALLSEVTQGGTLAIAASTLIAFALFAPLRRRVQRAVDRRFDRARYDGERTATAFAGRLRGQANASIIELDLVATVDAVVRPSATAVWLSPRRRGATRLDPGPGRRPAPR
jgi:hypothetical protein